MGDFRRAIELVIATHEGGFQKRVDDPGNWTPEGELRGTKFGISAHSFPSEDIEGLTLAQAEDLYRKTWGMFAAIDSQRVLTKILDLAVNMQWGGHGPATMILQNAINLHSAAANLPVDGVFGSFTAAACNEITAKGLAEENALLGGITIYASAYYLEVERKHVGMKQWAKNWKARATWIPPVEKEPEISGI